MQKASHPLNAALNKRSLHAVIDRLLADGGTRIAIEDAADRIDYASLDRASHRLAQTLMAHGVSPGEIVALPMPASIDYVIGMLATIRAGAIFMPVDPGFPAARLAAIFERARPRVVLAADLDSGKAVAVHCGGSVAVLTVRDHARRDAGLAGTRLPIVAGDDDTGYLIHTSGSTGEPKLIAGRNKGLSHFAHWEVGELGLDASVRASFLAPPTFDVSLREILVPLLAGGTLVVPDTAIRQDASRLTDWLRTREITLLHIVPSLFRLITRALSDLPPGGPISLLPALRHVCLAGEPLYGTDVSAWRAAAGDGATLVNLYGPSETTLAKAFHRVDTETYAPGAIVPIGQPIANAALLILRQGRLAEIGEIGEIHIRTPFASNGYWQAPERTAEGFVANPLSDDPTDRIYRTGDLGRFRPDRSVEFVGRADRQVKVDGVRIELNEIEGALRAHPSIDDAAAQVFRQPDGGMRLVGYFTGANAPDPEPVREHLSSLLPAAMLPAHLVRLDALPRNLNGKIDRKALPRPEVLLADGHADSPPEGDTEQALAALWAEALGLAQVGALSHWLTLGGNSLRAIGLIGRINRRFGAALTIRDFFDHGTVRRQAALLAKRRDDLPALTRVADADSHPLTEGQKRLWILSRLDDGESLYNNVDWLELRGALDVDALHAAFEALVQRHESLRTVFFTTDGGEPRQRILPTMPVAIVTKRLPAPELREAALNAVLQRERALAFDLERGPLMRLTLLRESEDHHHLMATLHHIVSDGWSMGVLTADLATAYRAAIDGRPTELPEPSLRPRDLADWQAKLTATPVFERCKPYWRTQLAGVDDRAVITADEPPPMTVPGKPDEPGEAASRLRARRVEVPLDMDTESALRALIAARGATPFVAIAAALAVLIQRYGGREQVVIGTAVSGRGQPGLESLVGFCVNTLPLVLRLSADTSFADLLGQTARVVADLHAHQAMPLERLLAERTDSRDPLANPLFEVFLAAEPAARDPGLPGLQVIEHEVPEPPARYDLSLRFAEDGPRWRLLLEYRETLWQAATMSRFANHLGRLLASASRAPDLPIGRLRMLADDELAWLEASARGPQRALPTRTLGQWFSDIADRHAEQPALIGDSLDDGTLDYGTLEARTRACAQALQAAGIKVGDIVALKLPRGADWVIALLGILKAGAVAQPLDPRHPPARLTTLLADAAPAALVTDEPPAGWAGRVLRPADLACAPDAAQSLPVIPIDAPAYLIHTSGSTGTPKGVLVSHRAFGNMIADQIEALELRPSDRVLQFVSPAFDAGLFEVFAALLSGAALAIAPRDEIADAGGYAMWCRTLGVTVAACTPSFLNTLPIEALAGLRLLVTGGEAPIPIDVRRVRTARIRYVNAYGPTEAAVNAALHEVSEIPTDDRPLPLGRPTANCSLRVVAPDLSPLPHGIPGELLIGGAGVALGYLNRPALDARAFVVDALGERHYRTGDRARREADGSIRFLGRLDEQLKIRGHRVEPGEIEASLRTLPGVGAVHVRAWQHGPDTGLLAYWVARGPLSAELATPGKVPSNVDLRQAAAALLPDHAVPDHFIQLDALPLNANGKLDASRLPAPHFGLAAGLDPASAAPATPDEARLVAVWREVLDLPESVTIGRDSDFFTLGGRSLAASRLALRAGRALGREVRLRDLYAAPTPAALLARLTSDRAAPLQPLPDDQPSPLSPMQRRLWIIEQLGDAAGVYHIAGLTQIEGALDPTALGQAFDDLCARQGALRTRIVVQDGGEPRLVTDAPGSRPVLLQSAEAGVSADEAARLAARPFDLARDWPIRAQLWRCGPDRWQMLVVLHHLAADGWSMPILARELTEAYAARLAGNAPDWPAQPLGYRELAAWMAREFAEGAHNADAAYWREELADELPLLDLPTDRPRPPVRRFRGATHALALPAAATDALHQLASSHRTTPFAAFLTLVATLLARLSGQDEIVVGVPFGGRSHPASENVVGFFVNTLPIRARIDRRQTLEHFLDAVGQRLEGAQQHQGFPFDRLVEQLAIPRDTARSPVFDVLVSLDEGGNALPQLTGTRAHLQSLPRAGSRCDLWWMLDLTDEAPTLRVEYDSDLFDATTIADWSERLVRLALAAAAAPATRIEALPWLADGEWEALTAAAAPASRPLPTGTVLDRFEAIAAARPDTIALIDDDGTTDYGTLDAAAARLARRLRQAIAASPVPATLPVPVVALMLERGPAMIAALLACMKAGCAYLPIEPDSPPQRAALLLEDSHAALLLHAPGVPLPASTLPAIALPLQLASEPEGEPAVTPEARAADDTLTDTRRPGPDDPICLMYTSGSTGRPKGVVVRHASVLSLVADTDYYRPEPGDRLLQLSNYAFDGSSFDFFAALSHGLPLALPDRETVLDTERLAAFVARHAVNIGFVTTALLNRIADTAPDMLAGFRRLYFGGQDASMPHVRRAHAAMRDGALVHVYGPTETTTFATWHPVALADLRDGGRRLPIGRPIARTLALVVDACGLPQPPGVPGELWIGGAGVSAGYLGQAQLTSERFVETPLSTDGPMYRSGDLCLGRRDGTIEFLGRLDGQVKLRGYRIELGEIEGRLASAPGVGKAHVLARPGKGGNLELIGYLTPADPSQLPLRSAIHEHLARWLPPYMIPAQLLLLGQLPLNRNGKVDVAALPDPVQAAAWPDETPSADGAPAACANPAQAALIEVWQQVLRLGSVQITDNYFAIGGDSIQALQIVARLREMGWTLKVTDLLRHPTIAALAPLLALAPSDARDAGGAGASRGNAAGGDAAPRPEDDRPPLTPIQRWFLAQGFASPAHFNQSLLIRLSEGIDDGQLQAAVSSLWRRHDGLRLVFGGDGDAAWQRVLPVASAPRVEQVEVRDAAALTADAAQRQRRFDTATGPLFAATRYRLPEGDRLFLCAHHWVIDGVSWRTLLEELAVLLAGRAPAAPGTSFAAWARVQANLPVDSRRRDWWQQHAGGLAARLPRVPGALAPAALSARRQFVFELDATDTRTLTASGHAAYQTRGDELLLAALVLALVRSCDASAQGVRLTLESHGRDPQAVGHDASRTVGWLTAMFPVRFSPSTQALPVLIREVKETLRAIPDQGASYGVLRWIEREPALAAAAPPELGFNYLGRFDQDAALPIAPEPTGDELAPETRLPHGLDITAEVRENRLQWRLVADTQRHPEAWCERLAESLLEAVREIAAHCRDPEAGGLSPSDVDLDGIDIEGLDDILAALGKD